MNLSLFRGYLFRVLLLLIVGLLSFEFYMFFAAVTDRRNRVDHKYIRDYERVLCSFTKPKTKPKIKPEGEVKKRCPSQGIVTMFMQGPLANNMWQYANVIAAAITVGLDPFVPGCVVDAFAEVFANASVPPLSEIGHCYIPLPESASSVEEWTESQQSIVIRSNDLYNEVVLKYLELFRNQFAFTPALEGAAGRLLHSAKPNATGNVTYVGVYITKTSVIVNQEYDDVYPSVQFFVDAMHHFRVEYPNAVFVVITDRKAFWEGIFGTTNVFVLDEETLGYGVPLAVLAHCNHTILASDDFAVWAAILTGGDAIVSFCISEDFRNLMQNKKNWKYLQNNTKSINKYLDRLF